MLNAKVRSDFNIGLCQELCYNFTAGQKYMPSRHSKEMLWMKAAAFRGGCFAVCMKKAGVLVPLLPFIAVLLSTACPFHP